MQIMQPPGFLTSLTKFSCEIVHGYVFGVKDSNGYSQNFLSRLPDLETQGHFLFMERLLLFMTFTC